MHSRGRRDTLVYWLEFKNDDELPDYFGSIRGGPSKKFGLYQEKGSGKWFLRKHRAPKEISLREAIEHASHQRDQLVAGAKILSQINPGATEREYQLVQREMNALDAWVIDTAWAHKYFTLLFPDRLDNYHSFHWQQFHLVKLWTVPHPGRTRYLNAHPFIEVAGLLGIHPINLTYTLNDLNGRPHPYWAAMVAPVDPVYGPEELAPLGLPDIDVLNHPPRTLPAPLRKFLRELREDDLVFWSDGKHIGSSEMVGPTHRYVPGSEAPYRRKTLRSAWTPLADKYSSIFGGKPFRLLELGDRRDAAFVVAMERLFAGQEEEQTPLHLEAIEIEREGRLQQFRLELAATPPEHIRGLNLSVLVGENGTGKTTLLKTIAGLWESNLNAEGDRWVEYTVRGKRCEAGRRAGSILKPGAMPSRVIVSSYAALDRYDRSSRLGGLVPYIFVGVSRGEEMAAAHLAILRTLYKQDSSLLARRDRTKLEAVDRLLQMVDYGNTALVKFCKAPLVQGVEKQVDIGLVEGTHESLARHLGLKNLPDEDVEALGRLLEFAAVTPGLSGPDQMRKLYPGSVAGWLEDLAVATRLRVQVIEDLYFQRREAMIPLLELSSGEQSLVFRFFRILDEIRENAVVIIDEPEIHLHPRWIMRFVELLQAAFQDYRCHFLLATHSPLLASDLPHECTVSLEIDSETYRIVSRKMDEETLGSNPRQILYRVFGITETVGPLTRSHIQSVEKAIESKDRERALNLLERMGDSALKFDLYRRIDELRRKPEGQH